MCRTSRIHSHNFVSLQSDGHQLAQNRQFVEIDRDGRPELRGLGRDAATRRGGELGLIIGIPQPVDASACQVDNSISFALLS